MEVQISTKITKYFSGESGSESENFQKSISNLIGGSNKKFDYDPTYDQSIEIENNFSVKDCQTFQIELMKDNTFNKDILTMINTPKDKITFISIFCLESTDNESIPLRFKLSAELADNIGSNLEIGILSSFSLSNFSQSKITKLFINEIQLPEDKSALLSINIGSSNTNA